MASFWLYIIAIPLCLILGGLLIFILYGFSGIIGDFLFYKKGIPKNRKKVSEWIKDNPKKFNYTNPGKPSETDIKEVKEDERKRFERYREFEKLRRVGIQGGNKPIEKEESTTRRGELYTPTVTEPPRESSLQIIQNPGVKDDKQKSPGNRPRVKLDE